MASLLVVREREVAALLADQDDAVMEIVRETFLRHEAGETVVPTSAFLRLPGTKGERIIAMPAFVGGEAPVAGLKWIASFPGNRGRGLERATGIVMLNCPQTGRPLAVLGGSAISALRTAAGAALAASLVWPGSPPASLGVIGCGRIAYEVLRLLTRGWSDARVRAYDSDPDQARRFRARCAEDLGVSVTVVQSAMDLLTAAPDVLVLATTASAPWLDGLGATPPRLVLHLSLRDLAPEVIAFCRNVVDDVTHVCRERTSVELAALRLGHRRFIAATIGELLRGTKTVTAGDPPVVVSPFGLGILDVAVGALIYQRARTLGVGTAIDDAT